VGWRVLSAVMQDVVDMNFDDVKAISHRTVDESEKTSRVTNLTLTHKQGPPWIGTQDTQGRLGKVSRCRYMYKEWKPQQRVPTQDWNVRLRPAFSFCCLGKPFGASVIPEKGAN